MIDTIADVGQLAVLISGNVGMDWDFHLSTAWHSTVYNKFYLPLPNVQTEGMRSSIFYTMQAR